ncbi:MAG: flotillin-like protein FloA, partial [Planctomycetota bacterium]
IQVTTAELENHYLAGGRPINVVRALIAANRANIQLDWKVATAIDLAGRDILDAVQTSVNPKVIDCPNPAGGKNTVDAVAKDGIQVKAKARVTVRANIDRLVGGATEETIVARVGEGIVTTIGSAETYKDVLENPDGISRRVLEKGLDAGTAFEILSIDIADVDVGENVGAKLQADQAEADKRRFQAEAEKRRAMASAREQEMKALTQENRAKVVEAEAEIPKAIAEAFHKGNLGVMDYYRFQNIQADTSMRENIGGEEAPPENPEE